MTARLAVFDCDGTLVDSQANIVRAMADCFARHRLDAPDAHRIRRVVGLSLVEVMAALLPDGDAALHAALAADYRDVFQRLRADDRLDPEPLYPGIRDGLDALATAGWRLGVATGKSDRGLALLLDHHGLTSRFATLQTADRHPSKPHPAMLRAALREGGATAGDSVMIGDTVFDMAMATAAGVRAIGVDWGYHEADELHDAGAGIVVATMDELLRDLLEDA